MMCSENMKDSIPVGCGVWCETAILHMPLHGMLNV